MNFPEIKDVLRRREIKKLTNKELSDQLQKVRKRLNRRMRELERTGYSEYSGSYDRLVNYIRSNLGGHRNVMGQWEFTTAPYSKATRRAREELLLNWEHKLSYDALTSKSVKEQLQKEADRLTEKTGKKYNIEKIKNIKDMMKSWRENLDSAITSELFDSDSARQVYEENPSISKEQRLIFLENLEETFMNKNTQTINAEKLPYFKLWLDNYNFNKNRSEIEYGGVYFNPITGEIYDGITNYKIDVDTSTSNKVFYLINGAEKTDIKEIGENNLYDYIFNKHI